MFDTRSTSQTSVDVCGVCAYSVQGSRSDDWKPDDVKNHGVDRFWWRSKEALDTAFALEAAVSAAPSAEYVIFLQDDIVVAQGLLSNLTSFTKQQAALNKSIDVMTLFTQNSGPGPVQKPDPHAFHWGMVGVVFRSAIVKDFVTDLRANFSSAPVDWLLNGHIEDKGLNFWAFYPNLVQHMGISSSLQGRRQTIRSPSFRDRRCWVS